MISKQKGNLALAHAIRHFMTEGYEVCSPLSEPKNYDLIIEKSGKMSRVQVKYGGLYANKTRCKVALRVMGGNQSYHYATKYTDDAFDFLFVYTAKNQEFVIPWSEIGARSELSIEAPKYVSYRVSITQG